MAVKIDKEKCTGCGLCVDTCPCEAIEVKDGVAVINEDECTECQVCIDECANGAISIK